MCLCISFCFTLSHDIETLAYTTSGTRVWPPNEITQTGDTLYMYRKSDNMYTT